MVKTTSKLGSVFAVCSSRTNTVSTLSLFCVYGFQDIEVKIIIIIITE